MTVPACLCCRQCPSLEEPLLEAQRSAATLRRYRSLLPSLLRQLSGAAVHQRRAGSAAAGHQARALLDDIAAADSLFS